MLLRHRSHVDDDLRIERQRIDSVVDDWAVMTDDERKQVIQMIFAEIRADHTPDGQKVEFMPRAAWAPMSKQF